MALAQVPASGPQPRFSQQTGCTLPLVPGTRMGRKEGPEDPGSQAQLSPEGLAERSQLRRGLWMGLGEEDRIQGDPQVSDALSRQ